MRKSFKWLLSLVPVAAGSIGTAVYLTSEKQVGFLREFNPEQKKVIVETRINPLSSSQDNKEILDTNNLVDKKIEKKSPENSLKVVAPVNSKTSKTDNELKETEKSASIPILDVKKELPSVPKIEKKPESTPKILVAPPDQEKHVDLKPETKNIPEKVNKTSPEVAIIAEKPNNTQLQNDKNPKKIKKVVLVDPSTSNLKNKKEAKQEKKEEKTLISPVLGNVEVQKETKNPEVIPPVVALVPPKKEEKIPEKALIPVVKVEQKEQPKTFEENPKTQEINKTPETEQEIKKTPNPDQHETEAQVLDQKSSDNSNFQTNEQVVGNIVVKLVEDLKDLAKLRKSVYEYKFTKKEQMALFLQKFPKVTLTEQQAHYLANFWENNYAHFYPDYAPIKSIRDQWRKELRDVLVIEPEPEIGPFNRISGGHVFIFDGKNTDWVSATPSGGSDVP